MASKKVIIFVLCFMYIGQLSCSQPTGNASDAQEKPDVKKAAEQKAHTETASIDPKIALIKPFGKQDIEELCASASLKINELALMANESLNSSALSLAKPLRRDIAYPLMFDYIRRLKKHAITYSMLLNPCYDPYIKHKLGSHSQKIIEYFRKVLNDISIETLVDNSDQSTNYLLQQLIFAILSNDLSKVRELAAKVSNINAFDCFELTPLHYAALIGNPQIINYLLEQKAESFSSIHGLLPCLLYSGDDKTIIAALNPGDRLDRAVAPQTHPPMPIHLSNAVWLT